MNSDELMNRMAALDEMATRMYPGTVFRCIIVGGSALLSLKIISRSTLDVDVIDAPVQLLNLFDRFDFNTKVQSLSYCFPLHYLDRIHRINLRTKTIEFYTPSIEDLIVSKLYAYRSKDIDDINDIIKSGRYNEDLLATAVADAEASSLNDRQYREMFDFYQRNFIKR